MSRPQQEIVPYEKIAYFRRIVLVSALAVIVANICMGTGIGTFSSFGWNQISAICPLGAIETMFAGKTVHLHALIALLVALALTIVFGKAACSWICPVGGLRELTERIRPKLKKKGSSVDNPENAAHSCPSCVENRTTRRHALGSRHIVLLGTLLSATVFGFPVFCLVCPIGLVVGTVVVGCQIAGGVADVELSAALPLALLAIELIVLKQWCGRFCPLGALISLFSIPNRMLKPQVKRTDCLREKGSGCQICKTVCPENLDPHFDEGMNECIKCGSCHDQCPAQAIKF